MTPVLIAPLFDPGTGRVDMEMPAGLTVAQMVARGLPDMVEADLQLPTSFRLQLCHAGSFEEIGETR